MALAFRVIARLDIKGDKLIKGVQMEGLRVIGDPNEYARRYAEEGADELLLLDTVASLYGRQSFLGTVETAASQVFVPLTVGGGVRSLDDIRRLLAAGADKVAINTAAVADPAFIGRAASYFGAQAIAVSVEAKRVNGGWEAYTEQGRTRTGRDAVLWAAEAAEMGAGEVILTSIDRDGTRRGPDMGLGLAVAAQALRCPVVLGGGISSPQDAATASVAVDALAIGAALHQGMTTIRQLKDGLTAAGREVR